ncbi:MAG: 4Fe-4S binding protein [Leptospiraceae bacterium]|nr:4Fe-4S binding protein [Leptospiraceae bacterium]
MQRKDFFKKGIFHALKKAVATTEEVYDVLHDSVSEAVSESSQKIVEDNKEYTPELPGISKAKKINRNLKSPPGALKDKSKFLKKCSGCGDCIQVCPYNTIFPVYDSKLNKNIPYLDPNMNACMICVDFPCINACETGALKPLKKNEKLKLGQAKPLVEHCINTRTKEKTCDVCQTSCPVENVISYTKIFQPRISKDCTGCGICVQACPTFPRAIVVK